MYRVLKDNENITINNNISASEKIIESLSDDLNSAQALYEINLLADQLSKCDPSDKERLKSELIASGNILGILQDSPSSWLKYGTNLNNIDSNIIEELIEKRKQARKDKNFSEADNIRLELNNMGIEIEDTKDKTVWEVKSNLIEVRNKMGIKDNINITFPDGNKREFEKGITGYQIAESIAKSLAKEAIAINIDGIQKDLCDQIDLDSSISIITINTDEGLDIMRHTLTAQVLAKAVKTLYPKAKLAIGPTIEHGFYYDVLFEKPISSEDLPKIEKEMNKIISNGEIINKKICSKKDAIKLFEERNETYKIDIINNSDQNANFQIYSQEKSGFIDLCYGPHLPNLRHIGAFKLTKLAGAYWKGDSNNEMLQRIYGTAWKNKNDLDKHLDMLKEAEKRDHRKLGVEK